MSYVNGQKTLERGLKALFVKAYDAAEEANEIKPFILETQSDGADEEFGWLGQSPEMVEWVDERQVKALNSFSYKLVNKDYEATLGVDRNALEDDRLGAVKVRINDLAQKAKVYPRKLFIDALINGTTDLCYDGQAFFSASHSEGDSGTQTNLQTGAGVTLDNLVTDLEECEAQMLGFKDDQGKPLNEGEIMIGIVCPPALKNKFDRINTLDFLGVNNQNIFKGRIKAIVSSSRLTDANDWYFANIANGIKPLIRQVRQPVKFSSLEGESDKGFMSKKYHYGVDSREVFGYGLWQRMIKVTN